MNILKIILTITISLFIFTNTSFGVGSDIKFHVSPIKYTIDAYPGETITRKAKLSNYKDETMHIVTSSSDFQSKGTAGVPTFLRKSELVNPDQTLSERIDISIDSFDIVPNEIIEIEFTINIPENATPGGHYGAVFFKNDNSALASGNAIAINVDYGVLILLNVAGEVDTEAEIKTPIVNIKKSNSGNYKSNLVKDDCKIDFTISKYDGKCFDKPNDIINQITGKQEEDDKEQKNNDNDNLDEENNDCSGSGCNSAEDKEDDNFIIEFEVPIENTGNTHIKPDAKIIILEVDENGNKKELKSIGKEVELNEKGAEIGERIVDYIPLNDREGYVLPGSTRVYKVDWKGFPYKDYDENGDPVIKYFDPSTYYTKQNINDAGFLMPWERVCSENKTKKIEAIFDISYLDENGELIEYQSAKEFDITYEEKVIKTNPYVITLIGILFGFLFLIWIIFILRKKECIKCERKIDKDLNICPYCNTKQDGGFSLEKEKKKKKK